MASFIATRVTFGLCIGFCIQVPHQIGTGDGTPAYILLGMATSLAILIVYVRSNNRLYSAAPSLLVISIIVLFLPFLDQGDTAASSLSAGFVWLAWATLSAAQLSELKSTCGMSELGICAIEKCLLSLCIVGGAFLHMRLVLLLPLETPSPPLQIAATSAAWALILVALCSMASLIGARKEDEYQRQLQQNTQRQNDKLFSEIAGEFGLSEREREIVTLLSEGYSRSYIKDALCVSEETVKAHVAHIYQKIGIHRKDDLLDLVEMRRRVRRNSTDSR